MAGNNTFAPQQVGDIEEITVADPVASSVTYTVPTTPDGGKIHLIRSIKFLNTTNSTVINRDAFIQIQDNVAAVLNFIPADDTQSQVASTAVTYFWMLGYLLQDFSPAYSNNRSLHLPAGLWLAPGWDLDITFNGAQAADRVTDIRIIAQTWKDPN